MSGEQDSFKFSNSEFNQSLLNATRYNNTQIQDYFTLPFWRQVFWYISFALTVLAGTLGNCLVIWIICANKNMRTVTNYPLVNLSVSDALTSTLNTVFNFYTMLHNEWIFGNYCKINQFISHLCISVSVFTLMAISIDRYMALVVDVTRGPPSKRATLIIGVAVWTASVVISVPAAIINEYDPGNSTTKASCTTSSDYKSYYCYYNIIFSIVTYVVPVGSMIYSYIRVGIVLRRSKNIGENNLVQLRVIEDRKRMVLMMIVVVLLFALSWFPFQIYFVVEMFVDLSRKPYVQEMYLVFYWLAMSHSAYHPIVYWHYLKNFRNSFKRIYRSWC